MHSHLPPHTRVPADGNRDHTAIVLHGVFGAARNLRSLVTALAAARPRWAFVTADLRCHAGFHPAPPHDLGACARDARSLCEAFGATAAIGHSYGGKVCAELLRDPPTTLRQVWMLDTQPHLREADDLGPAAAAQMIAVLRGVPQPLADRAALAPILSAAAVPTAVGQWLATSLQRKDDGWRWTFDLDGVAALLDSYYATDSWPLIERPPVGIAVEIVRAGASDRWDGATLARLAALAPAVRLHTIDGAGHWLHVDRPRQLVALVAVGLAEAEA